MWLCALVVASSVSSASFLSTGSESSALLKQWGLHDAFGTAFPAGDLRKRMETWKNKGDLEKEIGHVSTPFFRRKLWHHVQQYLQNSAIQNREGSESAICLGSLDFGGLSPRLTSTSRGLRSFLVSEP